MFLRQQASSARQSATAPEEDGPPPVLQRLGTAGGAVGPRPVEPVPPAAAEPPSAATVSPPPVAVAPAAGQPTPSLEDTGKRLIVGDGIRLKGEITACDRLIVEGHVEVTLNETRALEVRPSGCFMGSCEVEEGEISGSYEGDLTVRGRLTVRATGRIMGKIG